MQRLFITGGTGFFGKSMLDYRLRHADWSWSHSDWVILSRNPERFAADFPTLAKQPGISFIPGDIRNFAFPTGRFDAIIHAATSAVTGMPDDEMTSVIIDGTRRTIEFAKSCGCPNVLFVSSGAVYGRRTAPASENDACLPVTAYGKGKLAAEKMMVESGLNAKIARCFAFTGPHLNRRIHYAIGNFIQDCLDGKDIFISGDGTPLRSYLYADDLVEWLFAILERGEPSRPYNVGSAHAVSIAELAREVRNALHRQNGITIALPPSSDAAQVYVPDTSRIVTELGVKEKFDLASAISRSV